MVGFGQPMVNPIFMTDTIKDMVKGVSIALPMGDLIGPYLSKEPLFPARPPSWVAADSRRSAAL
jgi:hypothetical protein